MSRRRTNKSDPCEIPATGPVPPSIHPEHAPVPADTTRTINKAASAVVPKNPDMISDESSKSTRRAPAPGVKPITPEVADIGRRSGRGRGATAAESTVATATATDRESKSNTDMDGGGRKSRRVSFNPKKNESKTIEEPEAGSDSDSEESESADEEFESGSDQDEDQDQSDEGSDAELDSNNNNSTAAAFGVNWPSIMTGMMKSTGPIIQLVQLHSNGRSEELTVDMTPKLDSPGQLLGGKAGFIGEISELQTILMQRRDQDNAELPINQSLLPAPFNEIPVRGDILLIRMDDQAEPIDFTLKEWEEYCNSKSTNTVAAATATAADDNDNKKRKRNK